MYITREDNIFSHVTTDNNNANKDPTSAPIDNQTKEDSNIINIMSDRCTFIDTFNLPLDNAYILSLFSSQPLSQSSLQLSSQSSLLYNITIYQYDDGIEDRCHHVADN